MPTFNDLLVGDEEAWIGALAPYQAEHIRALLKRGNTAEEVAKSWLAIKGPANTYPFGGEANRGFQSLFYDKLLAEVEAYICGDERYENDRKKLFSELKPTHAYAISTISVAVSPVLGAAAPLIAPAIALILYTAARLGTNAWCAARKDARSNNAPAK